MVLCEDQRPVKEAGRGEKGAASSSDGDGLVGSGSSVLRAMSCHPEFKCNLEIARKGKRRGG